MPSSNLYGYCTHVAHTHHTYVQVNAHSLEEVSLDRAFGVEVYGHLGELREFLVELLFLGQTQCWHHHKG